MKFDVKPMEVVKGFTASAGALALLGSLCYAAGWVVSRAQAGEMIAQSAVELQKKYDRKLLEVDIQALTLQITLMETKPERSAWENEQLRIWKLQLDEKTKLLLAMTADEARGTP